MKKPSSKARFARPKGVKVVPAPKSRIYREWAEGPDITIDGGYHSLRKPASSGVKK